MSTKQVPVSGQVDVAKFKVAVQSAYGSAGAAFANSTDATSVEVVNDNSMWPVEYQVGAGPWSQLLSFQSTSLEISLAATSLKLRRAQSALAGSVEITVNSKPSATLLAGDDVVQAGTVGKVFCPQQYSALAGMSGGVNDDTAAVSAAITAALAVGGTVDLGSGDYRVTAPLPEITRRMAIIGHGEYQCRIYYDKAATGICLKIRETWIGADASILNTDTSRPVNGQVSGVRLAHFSIWGDRTTANSQDGIVLVDRNDNFELDHVSVQFVKGYGFAAGVPSLGVGAASAVGLIRESSISGLQVRWCGDSANSKPAFFINSDGYRTGDDASNNLWIENLKSIYSDGCGFFIRGGNVSPSPNQARYITIRGAYLENDTNLSSSVHAAMVHGRVENLDMQAELQGPHTDIGAYCLQLKDLVGQKVNNSRFNLTWGPVARAVDIQAVSNIELRLGTVSATVCDVNVGPGSTRPVTIYGVGEESTGATQAIIVVNASIKQWVRVVPPRQIYSLSDRPVAATYLNSAILVTDGGAAGVPQQQYSDGVNWIGV